MKHFTDVDCLLHTGDHHEDLDYIIKKYKVKALGVRGNCDWRGAADILKGFAGRKIFLCHGHQYNVKLGLNSIYYKGLEKKADIVIFGHTHVPLYTTENNLVLLNPGSTSLPRGGSAKGCAVLELGEEIKVKQIKLD
jgi:putative phosphoesterase